MANFWQSTLWQSILNADWAWASAAWLLLGGAVLLFVWAMYRDRPGLWGIPRERCPKCRYDMAGRADDGDEADGPIQCPECGKRVRHAKALRKTRRRWGMALLAVPLLVGWHLAENQDRIRRQGWISVTPTIVLMAVVDVEDWFDLMLQEWQGIGQPQTLAEHLHRRLVTSDFMMSLWLTRASGLLRSEDITVIDASAAAPVRLPQVVSPWTSIPMSETGSPFWFDEPVLDDTLPEELRELILASIDPNAWADNGSVYHGPFRRAGDRFLVRATPDVLEAIRELVDLIGRARVESERSHEARIHGKSFFVVSLDYFADAEWLARDLALAVEEERRARALAETHLSLGLGGGGTGPWGGGRLLFGKSYAAQTIRDDYIRPIFRAFRYETSPRYWGYSADERIDARWIGEMLVVFSDGLGSEYFEAALQQIHSRGPEPIIAEHESEAD